MSKVVNVYTGFEKVGASIDQIALQRDWMDITFDRHAYHCFPMTLANRLGWGISFPEDIVLEWDGINDSTPDHVKILEGEKYVYGGRGNRTISFRTGLIFDSEENISLLTMPVPNQFIRGAQCITTIISSSVIVGDLPIAWMITEPNIKITIPAGTPVAAVVPISLSDIQSYEMFVNSGVPEYMASDDFNSRMQERGRVSQEKNQGGEWTHFYRDATDHTGEKRGQHEAKKIIMKVTNNVQEEN